MLRKSELDFFYQDGTSQIFADYFEEYQGFIPPQERDDLVKAYYKRLISDDREVYLGFNGLGNVKFIKRFNFKLQGVGQSGRWQPQN